MYAVQSGRDRLLGQLRVGMRYLPNFKIRGNYPNCVPAYQFVLSKYFLVFQPDGVLTTTNILPSTTSCYGSTNSGSIVGVGIVLDLSVWQCFKNYPFIETCKVVVT